MDVEVSRMFLLDHAKHPRNRLPSDEPVLDLRTGECRNPMCGDHVKIFIKVINETIDQCWVQVEGCTMCTAATSVMSEQLQKKSVVKALDLASTFENSLALGSNHEWSEDFKDFAHFDHLRKSPARIPCALIPWQALKNSLK